MADEPRKLVLADHVKVKRKLLSPFMASMGGTYAPYSWTKQLVPEAVWLALIIDRYGFDDAARYCLELTNAMNRIIDNAETLIFSRLSSFAVLNERQKNLIVGAISQSTKSAVCVALAPLSELIAHHPLSFIFEGRRSVDPGQDLFVRVLDEIYDRNSRLSVLSMALAYLLGIQNGKIHVAADLIDDFRKNLSVVKGYPNTEAAKEAAGFFRASAPMLFMSVTEGEPKWKDDNSWKDDFWNHIAGFGGCTPVDTPVDEQGDDLEPIERFIFGFRNAVRFDLHARLDRWELDLNEVEIYEVVGSLLARQATLARDLASAPSLWTPHAAPILLRAMADVFITLAWILKKPDERSKIFVEDGLGAIKLMIAHQEHAIANAIDPYDIETMQRMLETWRSWIASQRLGIFIEVNLGSWSGMSTRKMAEEAGFLDFYNHVYQPFSGAAHSNWFHLNVFNSSFCENPAHRGHLIPAIVSIDPDPHWLYLAAKYLKKTFAHFDEVNNFVGLHHLSYDYMVT